MFDADIVQLLDVDMKGQILDGVYYLTEHWTDGQLTWNPADYGGIQSLALPGDTIWEPKIRLLNDVDFAVSKNNHMTTMLKVMSNRLVLHYCVDRMKSSCSIGLRYFPFDQQNCTLSFSQLQ